MINFDADSKNVKKMLVYDNYKVFFDDEAMMIERLIFPRFLAEIYEVKCLPMEGVWKAMVSNDPMSKAIYYSGIHITKLFDDCRDHNILAKAITETGEFIDDNSFRENFKDHKE